MAPHGDFATVMRLIFEGKLKSIVGATFPLEQAADAQRALEQGEVFGKVVLEI
jgi:NADPH:quinone reductase-like Zn-dependent oxidoreductase